MIITHARAEAVALAILCLAACSQERRESKPDTNAVVADGVETNAADAVATNAIEVPKWITAEAGPSSKCPLTAAEGSATLPFFRFNGTTDAPDFSCRQTGPFEWEGKQWYVQRIHSLTTTPESTLPPGAPKLCTDAGFASPCLFDGTRACSTTGANVLTPAGSKAGSGGCGVYEATRKFRKKP